MKSLEPRYRIFLSLVALFCVLTVVHLSAQSDPAADLQRNIADQARIVATANDLAVAKYRNDFSNWQRNVELLKAAGQPAAAEPKPPTIVMVDQAKFAAAFTGYVNACFAQASQLKPCGELDVSSAFTTQLFPAIPQTATKPPPSQPDIPLGAPMGGGYFGVAPGDAHAVGYVYTNDAGIRFEKHVKVGFGGLTQQWYQLVE